MVQLRSSFFPSTGEHVSQQRVAFRMIATLCAATAIVDAVYFFLAFRLQQPQMFALAWVTLFFFGVTLAGTWLVRSGQLGGAAWLISGAMAIIWPLITGLWVSDIGLILSVSPALMSLALAQMMPRKQVPWAVALGVIASIVTILLDMFGQPGRLFVSELQILIALTVALIVLAYGYFFTQGFADYPLRIKLILAFLVVTIVAVGVVDAVTDLTIRTILNRDTTENLQTLADAQARLIGDILTNEVETLQVMTHNDIIHQALDQGDFAAYDSTNLAAIQKLLSDLDEQWQQVDEQDPLVRSRLDSAAAAELTDLQRSSANNAEVFITDQYGAVVAATGKTSDFNQADEQWWQAAYNQGRGGVYIGLPEFDESSQTFGVNLALPIYDDADPVRVAGVLRSTYSFAGLTNLLLTIKGEQTDQITARLDTDLLIEDQIWHLDDDRFEPIASETLAAILATETQGVGEFEFEGVMSLVGQSFIRVNSANSQPASLNWRVLTYVEREATLGPIRDQRQNILLVGLGVLLATTVIAVGVTRLLADPITRLTAVAEQVAAGNLTAQVPVQSTDEIGALAAAFNTMTARLRENIDNLEDRVTGRTRQLETVVELSQRLSRILDLNELMRQVVTLVKERFNYYHVHIYLLAADDNSLVMAEGYGPAGAEMKRQGHHIPLSAPKSLVARAARERELITVGDVRQDPNWLPNPLLPETRSEIAIPVQYGAEVVGVLDVQSDKVGGLSQEDEAVLRALANQIANAVHNARQFAATQAALERVQHLQSVYTGQAWQQLGGDRTRAYDYRQSPLLPPLDAVPTPEAVAALREKRTVDLRLPAGAPERDGPDPAEPSSALATPLKLRGQVIGILGLQNEDPDRQWTADEIALIEAVSEQMSLALENARLFEETQRNAWRDRVVSESTAKLWSAAEIEEVMRAAVAQLGDKLQASEVVLRLGTEVE